MKHLIVLFAATWMAAVLFPHLLTAQGIFTKVIDPTNPVTNFTNTDGQYKGVSWIDLDGDNLTDLFVAPKFLFHNDGNGKFTLLPNIAGATGEQGAAGASWGDLDNDGDPDFVMAQKTAAYFQNNLPNGFSMGGAWDANLLPPDYAAWDCAMADANLDGRLDVIFVHACCNFHPTPNYPCKFLLSNVTGGYDLVTGLECTDQNNPYTIPIWSDFDLDGDMDLFIGSGPANGTPKPDFNYRNMLKETGNFSLVRLTAAPWMNPQDGQTYNFVDIDNDGDLDACLTNYAAVKNHLWRNDNGTYVEQNTFLSVANQWLTNVWGDIDNDGDLDVLLTLDGNTALRLYPNKGDGTFAASKNIGITADNPSGAAFADYDNDGDLDLYVNGKNNARALFRNDTVAANRHWAAFTLQGDQSNRSAIGAKIRLKANIKGNLVWQIREIQTHNSFQSQNDLRQHFGLNTASVIDSLEILWPSSIVQRFAGLEVNRFYKIVENMDPIVGTIAPLATHQTPLLSIIPNPFIDSFTVRFEGIEERPVKTALFDMEGRTIEHKARFDQKTCSISDLFALKSGTYTVHISFANGISATQTIVKL